MAFHGPHVLHRDCCNCLATGMKLVRLPAQGHKHQKVHHLPVIDSSDFILASLFDLCRRTDISVSKYCVRACYETSSKELLLIRAQAQTLSAASLNKIFTFTANYVPWLCPHQQPVLRHPSAIPNWCRAGYLSCSHCVRGVAGDLSGGRQELRADCLLRFFAITDSLWDAPFPPSFLSPTESLGVCGWDGNYVMPRRRCSASTLLLSCEMAGRECVWVRCASGVFSLSVHPLSPWTARLKELQSLVCTDLPWFDVFQDFQIVNSILSDTECSSDCLLWWL